MKTMLVLFCTVLLLTACGKDEGSTDLNSLFPGGGSTVPIGSVQADSFWVDLRNVNGWTYLIHKSTGIADECKISADTTNNENITCYVEVAETTNFLNNYQIQYNSPPKMCRYVRVLNYYYYNFPTGSGPTNIWYREYKDNTGTPIAPFEECSDNGAAFGACDESFLDEWHIDNKAPVCSYNHSIVDARFPNCCTGNHTVITEEHDGASITNSSSSEASWGANYDRGCFGGTAAGDSQWPSNGNFRPGSVFYHSYKGTNSGYELDRPIDIILNQSGYTSMLNANFYTATPRAISGGTELDGTARTATQDAYEYQCLDEAGEVVHSVRVFIREWNTMTEYSKYLTTGAGDPDVSGAEGTNCDYEVSSGGSCNDYGDWDDFPAVVNFYDGYPMQILGSTPTPTEPAFVSSEKSRRFSKHISAKLNDGSVLIVR